MATVDWTDPCARAAALREAYYALIAGDRESSVRIRNGEHEREVTYGKADLQTLARELRQAESDCTVKNGGQPGRFAIRGGAMRPC